MALSAAMKAELQKQAPATFRVLSLVINGTTYLYGKQGGNFGSGPELIEPLVLSFGGGVRGINRTDYSLELSSRQVTLADTDQSFSQIVQGADRNHVRGATATIYLASPNVTPANWFTEFAGRVDTYNQSQPLAWTLTLSVEDQPLRRESVPKGEISRADWPAVSVDDEGLALPILYGRKSSANDTNVGALPTYYVDASGYRYLVCAGWAKDVDKVYVDGVLASSGTDYTVTHPILNGRQFTCIDFTSDQGSDAVVTCDAYGYEANGDGTGALISDPLAVLQHLLVNWVYGDYRSGSWLSSGSAPVDTTSFAATFFSDRGYTTPGLYLSERRKGLDVVNDYLASFSLHAWWTTDGKIAVGVEDFTAWAYATSHIIHQDSLLGWSLDYPSSDIVDTVEGSYGYDPITGDYRQYLNVKDLGTGEEAPETVDLPYSPAYII